MALPSGRSSTARRVVDQAVSTGVEQLRLRGGDFRAAVGQVARPAFMRDRRELAVAPGPKPDVLQRGRAVGGVIGDQRPRQHHLDRPSDLTRGQRCQYCIGTQEQFAAETAADVRRHDPHVLARDAQRPGQIASSPVDHLIGGPHAELVAIPHRDGSVRLHHRVRMIGCAVFGIQLHWRRREGSVEVADVAIGRVALLGHRGAGAGLFQVVGAHVTAVIDLDQLAGRTRLLEGFRHHHCNGLVVMRDLGTAQELGGVELALLQLAGVLRSHDAQHAWRLACRTQIDTADGALGDACAHHMPVSGLARQVMMFVGIRRLPGGLEWPVDTVDGLADDSKLIDGIGAGGSVEFHIRPSCRPRSRSGCAQPAAP